MITAFFLIIASFVLGAREACRGELLSAALTVTITSVLGICIVIGAISEVLP